MKIGYLAEPYEESHASGMGYAVLQVLRHSLKAGTEHEFVVYSSRPISQSVVPGEYTNILVPKSFVGKFWYFLFLRDNPDVLVTMLPMFPLWVLGTRTIPIFHELGSQKIRPKRFKEKAVALLRDHILIPRTLKRASHVVAVSQATKDDICKFYNVSEDKITLIYNGYQDWGQFKDEASAIDPQLKPYFFFAGKVKPRKNVHGLVEAFIAFKERTRSDCKLVIAGDYGGEYYQDMHTKLAQHNVLDDVHFLGYVDNSRMYSLYTNALACVFPSFNEGFGMPIVEAMSLGTPVITSGISATAEIGGDAALLIDPSDTRTLTDAMEQIYSNPVLRASLITKGLERSKQFSWDSFAQKFLGVVSTYGK